MALLAVCLLTLTGCTSWREYVANGFKVGPNYCRPAAPVADHWIDDKNPGVSSEPANDAAWWHTSTIRFSTRWFRRPICRTSRYEWPGLRISNASRNGRWSSAICSRSRSRPSAAIRDLPQVRTTSTARRSDSPTIGTLRGAGLGTGFLGAVPPGDRSGRRESGCFGRELRQRLILLLVGSRLSSTSIVRTAEQRLEYAAKNVVIQTGSLDPGGSEVPQRQGAAAGRDAGPIEPVADCGRRSRCWRSPGVRPPTSFAYSWACRRGCWIKHW